MSAASIAAISRPIKPGGDEHAEKQRHVVQRRFLESGHRLFGHRGRSRRATGCGPGRRGATWRNPPAWRRTSYPSGSTSIFCWSAGGMVCELRGTEGLERDPADERQGRNAPDARDEEAGHEEERGAGVDLAPGSRVLGRQHAGDLRLPGQHGGGVEQGVEDHVGPADARVLEGIEAALAVVRLHGGHQAAPADLAENQEGDDDQAGAHHDELQEVGHQHREHAAQDGVDGHADQQRGHHDLQPGPGPCRRCG